MIAVATFIDSHFGRMVQAGVSQYARESKHLRWQDLVAIPQDNLHTSRLSGYRLDGLIVAIWNSHLQQIIHDMGVPAVNVADVVPTIDVPSIAIDDQKVGEAAAAYFLDRGYRYFGYIPELSQAGYALRRGLSFTNAIRTAGFKVSWFGTWPHELPPGAVRGHYEVIQWLSKLPKPVAIFASEDRTAANLHASAMAAQMQVPEQIAILGVDNDPNMHYMQAGISSIDLPMQRVGYEAALLLDHLLAGEPPARPVIYLPPGQVITRTSSNSMAIEDSDVLTALRFIRDHAHQDIDVQAVAKSVTLGRRSLERYFRAAMGMTPKEEIQRIRVDNACKLLTTTCLSLNEIGRLSGFQSPSQFFVAFRKIMDMTPGSYRKRMRQA